jgi:hypothetical protein
MRKFTFIYAESLGKLFRSFICVGVFSLGLSDILFLVGGNADAHTKHICLLFASNQPLAYAIHVGCFRIQG